MRTLRRHVEEAEKIVSIGGVKTLIPQKGLPAPIRVDAGNESMEYAVSIRVIVEKYDRTGWAGDYLRAADDVCAEVWHRIPAHRVCNVCFGHVPEPRTRRERVWCGACGEYVHSGTLEGFVRADLKKMCKELRKGGIPVEAEKGERE